MVDLRLTDEQREMRETVRELVDRELIPVAWHPDRLQTTVKPLLRDFLDRASQVGLRTFTLSEAAGGAGADRLISCLVLEELGRGDPDVAAVLARTSALGRVLFERLMTAEQRARFLPAFLRDDRHHLAFAGGDPRAGLGWSYHRPNAAVDDTAPVAADGHESWVVNGEVPGVANAPLAKLFAVAVRIDSGKADRRSTTLLVPGGTPGLSVREAHEDHGAGEGPSVCWYHGSRATLAFEDCRVPIDHELAGGDRSTPAAALLAPCADIGFSAVNLGVGRAAYEMALDYAKLRRQGSRKIIEHAAIGRLLADSASRLEVARTMLWKAAWVADHPDAVDEGSPSALPLDAVAGNFTAEVVREVTAAAAECFGAMGVMRDLPLQKFVHDALVFRHSGAGNDARKLRIAEAVAGYRRPDARS